MAYFNNKRIMLTCAYEGGTKLKGYIEARSQHAVSLFQGFSTITNADEIIAYNDTENTTSFISMFRNCSNLMQAPSLNSSNVLVMNNMFWGCSALTYAPLYDTSKSTQFANMFRNCYNITQIPAYDLSQAVEEYALDGFVTGCNSLEEIHAYGISENLYIADSTQFTESALVEILNNLATVTTTKTLTMGATNLAKLTAEEIAIATNKGWTLA